LNILIRPRNTSIFLVLYNNCSIIIIVPKICPFNSLIKARPKFIKGRGYILPSITLLIRVLKILTKRLALRRALTKYPKLWTKSI
jgi:hypothetical protein